jgi:hypothetical protein
MCHDDPVNRKIDYSALLFPVRPDQVANFKAKAKEAGKPWATVNLGQVAVAVGAVLVFGIIMISVASSIFGVIAFSAQDGPPSAGEIIALIFPTGFIIAIVAIILLAARSGLRTGKWETWFRLDTFANANGMIFSPIDPGPSYPGAIFNVGDSRKALNHLRSVTDRYLDIGNYQYSTGSGKSRSTHTWGFMAMQLDRKLPNMVLDTKANNGLFGTTNLPATFAKNQVLSLEGDFNEHFTLYCPKQYERDALYVFTPDLMALLIDNAAPFDVEIVDDWMFVYSSTAFQSASPAVYQRLFQIANTVGAKTLAQTDRYVDHRVGDFSANYVAPQGQRLKRGVALSSVIVFIVVAAFWVLPNFLDLFGD